MVLEDSNFKRLFELSGDAMMVLGAETFVYANPAALEIYACPSMEMFCSLHPSDLSPQYQPCGTPSLALARQHIEDALRQGHKRFEWVHQRLTGEDFYTDVLLSTGVWEGEQVIQAIVRDISTYKTLQESLRREKEQSELAIRAKSEFLAVMSHEIRTPIHGILGAQELLLDSPLDAEQQQLVRVATDSTRHLLSLVNNVLDFSKIEAGKLVLENTPFSTTVLLTAVYDQFSIEAAKKSIEFTLDVGAEQALLWGDSLRVQQILSNLVSNAIKFTGAGGRVCLQSDLTPGSGPEGYSWQLTVSDNGIGMTAPQQEAAFDVFSQADSSISRSYGGTGLGLSISKSLAELLGGSIALESELGGGSTFTVTLPLRRAPAGSETTRNSTQTLKRNYGKSVLVAEDNPTNRFIIEKKLARLGLAVEVVANGAEALQSYRASLGRGGRSRFAAILMDIQMPVLNGIETARELLSLGCDVPVFALTADVQSDSRRQCLNAGMREFIGKPYEEAQLVSLFDRYFGVDETPLN